MVKTDTNWNSLDNRYHFKGQDIQDYNNVKMVEVHDYYTVQDGTNNIINYKYYFVYSLVSSRSQLF